MGSFCQNILPWFTIEFYIPPPFLDLIYFTSSHIIIQFGQGFGHNRNICCDPSKRCLCKQPLKIPGTGFHAPPTHPTSRIGQAVPCTLLGIGLPNFIPVVHQFGASCYGSRWAFSCTLVAWFTKPLETKINWFVMFHGHWSCYCTSFQSRTQEGI